VATLATLLIIAGSVFAQPSLAIADAGVNPDAAAGNCSPVDSVFGRLTARNPNEANRNSVEDVTTASRLPRDATISGIGRPLPGCRGCMRFLRADL